MTTGGLTGKNSDEPEPEKKFKRTLSLLESTLESIADGVLVVDRDGKIVLFNARFASLWRIPEPILKRHNDDEALEFVVAQLQEPDKFLSKVRDLYEHPEEESFDTLEFKDGRTFERRSLPQRIDGACVGRVWSFRDVTEQKQAERALEQSRTELQTYHDFLTHDVAGFATTLLAIFDFMLNPEGITNSPRQIEFLHRARRQGHEIQRLAENASIFSRLQRPAEESALDFEPSSIRAAIARAVEKVRALHFDETFDLMEDCPEDFDLACPYLEGIITNLLDNALRHRSASGKNAVRILARRTIDSVTIEIAGGASLPPEMLSRIFERHVKGPRSKGAGLGLALCKELVDRAGGTITAHVLDEVVDDKNQAVLTIRMILRQMQPQSSANVVFKTNNP